MKIKWTTELIQNIISDVMNGSTAKHLIRKYDLPTANNLLAKALCVRGLSIRRINRLKREGKTANEIYISALPAIERKNACFGWKPSELHHAFILIRQGKTVDELNLLLPRRSYSGLHRFLLRQGIRLPELRERLNSGTPIETIIREIQLAEKGTEK